MKFQLVIACLVLYSQITQVLLQQCVCYDVEGRTFEFRTISADHSACMEPAMSLESSSVRSCMESANKNGMNSFKVDSGVCYLYLAWPPADDTGTQQIYVARSPAPGSEGAPVCSEKCCKDGSTKTAGGTCFVMVKAPTLTWEDALLKCKETTGSRLVEAPTPEMIEELRQYIKDNGGISQNAYWVGLKRDSLGVWAWVETGPHTTAIPWYSGYPKSAAGYECGQMDEVSPTFYNFDLCNYRLRYICSELPATNFCTGK